MPVDRAARSADVPKTITISLMQEVARPLRSAVNGILDARADVALERTRPPGHCRPTGYRGIVAGRGGGATCSKHIETTGRGNGRRARGHVGGLPVPDWHAVIGDPNQADAICDRLLHDAHRIELTGPSLRRTKTAPKTSTQGQP